MFRITRMIPALLVFFVVIPCTFAQDDKVFRELKPVETEKFLQELKIEFNKTASPKGEETYFEYKRDKFRIRLTQYSPKELKLDCVFRGMSLEQVNAWNRAARFSKATHHKDGTAEITMLEYALDISGGATAGTIKQFVSRFDEDLKSYDKFVNGAVNADVLLATVANDNIENVLKSEGIDFKKKVNNAGVAMFDFELNGHNLRLYNFGGKDLMIDTHFRKISLENANRYNLNRKFVRVVNYKGKDVEYTALECNLDCEVGVTEGMIRHWITSFGEDARHFTEFTKKLADAEKK
jgi:Putative bacterial sensory transduction regulator